MHRFAILPPSHKLGSTLTIERVAPMLDAEELAEHARRRRLAEILVERMPTSQGQGLAQTIISR